MILFKRTIYLISSLILASGLFLLSGNLLQAIELTGPGAKKQPVVRPVVRPVKRPAGQPVGQQEYGPIAGKDTLWRIAFTMRPDKSLSVDQVMIAIFSANPHAFIDNNINLLKDGSMLLIPSASDIGAITKGQAQSKIVSDSRSLPQALSKITPQPATVVPKRTVKNNTKPDLTTQPEAVVISAPLERLKPIKTISGADRTNVRKQLNLAMNDMQLLIDENRALRDQITELTDNLDAMNVQEELDKQLRKDHKLLQRELSLIEEQASQQQSSIFNNGWFIAAVSSVPSVALLGGMMFWLGRKRPVVVAESKTSQSLPQQPEGEPDLSVEEGSMDDELDDDDLLIADDGESLNGDIDLRLDEELADSDDIVDELLVPEDDLEEILLDDDLDAALDQDFSGTDPDDEIISADDIDALLAEADTLEDTEVEGDDDSNNDDIISADDIDALLAEADALEDTEVEGNGDSNNDDGIVSADDIDALLAEADTLEDTEVEGDGDSNNDDGIVSADDIDALLAEADIQEDVEMSGDDDVDDIDALLAETAQITSETDTNIEPDIDVATDDIDALLAETAQLTSETETDIEPDIDVATDDIDALLAETGQLTSETETNIEPDIDVAADDIDALLAETGQLTGETETNIEPDIDVAADDIDALLAETGQLTGETETNIEPDIDVAADDIDTLLAETDDLSAAIDELIADEQQEPIAAGSIIADAQELADAHELANAHELADAHELAIADAAPVVAQGPDTLQQLSNADTSEQSYLLTTDEDISLMASGEAQHLVNALDKMIEPSGEVVRAVPDSDGVDLSELEQMLAATTPVSGESQVVAPAINPLELVRTAAETDEYNPLQSNSNVAAESFPESGGQSQPLSNATPDIVAIDKEQQLTSQLDKFAEENSYIDIDKLLDDSASSAGELEPYHDVDLDIGLDEFPDVIANAGQVDVDVDPNDSSKKLDLARAYLEIDEQDNAREMLEQVEQLGNDPQKKEAIKLLKKIKN